MDEERQGTPNAAEEITAHESERGSIERAMKAYAAFLRSIERYQKSVTDFRRIRETHEALHGLLRELSANRESAAAGRMEVRSAVRTYVQRLRAEQHTPEVTLRLVKRTFRKVVLSMKEQEGFRNPDALLEDTVRWAIEAYYEAA